jgi:dihydropteroate synthase
LQINNMAKARAIMQEFLKCGSYRLLMGGDNFRPLVMGILNVTPDSFSDGGQFQALEMALGRAEEMIAEGVDIIDVGGESSRPGAQALSLEEERRRVMPVLHSLRDCGKPISVDTTKPELMREAVEAGADMINDINGFRVPGALDAVRDSDCALCIMHMQSVPQSMQVNPQYQNVVAEVTGFLRDRVAAMEQAGIERRRMCVDPGFGFGKTLAHNFSLLKSIEKMQTALDLPLLAGLSRKSMIGAITGKAVEDRLAGSIAAYLAATLQGVRILRVHDVKETVDALKVWQVAVQ